MRNVMGAAMGHAALQELVELLRGGGSALDEHAGTEHAPVEHAPAEHVPAEHSGAEHSNTETAGAERTGPEHADGEHAEDERADRSRAEASRAECAGLLRGAVFYINMALWGPRRVPTLRVSFLAVLPAFLKVPPPYLTPNIRN